MANGFNPPGGFEAFGTTLDDLTQRLSLLVSIRRADLRLSERRMTIMKQAVMAVSIRRADLRLSERGEIAISRFGVDAVSIRRADLRLSERSRYGSRGVARLGLVSIRRADLRLSEHLPSEEYEIWAEEFQSAGRI
ncbi:hypothetical protein OSCT_0291 [Oscillochloris trichoides DG-6]|uniref:Uncharacterized protein n=1 Tax=Oscillochloris trichoides DG-6 TaxID=765420 RepID=E1IAE0_9CHLR|nr:hypothetical protein OSCT_0291 [Oscillochloris trichoides DG-6]